MPEEPKYTIDAQSSRGFIVTRKDPVSKVKTSVRVVSTGYGLSVYCKEDRPAHTTDGMFSINVTDNDPKAIPYYSYGALCHVITDAFLRNWESPKREGKDQYTQGMRFCQWLHHAMEKGVSSVIYQDYLRVRQFVAPDVLAVQRKAYSLSPKASTTSDLLVMPLTYKDDYVVKDLIQYRAAMAALLSFETFGPWGGWSPKGDFNFRTGSEFVLNYLPSWRDLYAYDHVAYTSLNRTLMNLPGGVPMHMLPYLRNAELEAPVTTRLKLLAVLSVLQGYWHRYEQLLPVIMRSTEEQIKTAVLQTWRYNHTKPDFRKGRSIVNALGIIFDVPREPGKNATIIGMAEASLDYHRNAEAYRVKQEAERLAAKTAVPPIELPTTEGIRFLPVVQEVVAEGDHMGHCVAGYASKAVSGGCYLFHIDYAGEEATAEVSREGRVIQVRGPHNRDNKATVYGNRVLNAWADDLRKYNRAHAEVKQQVPAAYEYGGALPF